VGPRYSILSLICCEEVAELLFLAWGAWGEVLSVGVEYVRTVSPEFSVQNFCLGLSRQQPVRDDEAAQCVIF